jgi:hypothetical protein
MPQSYEAFLDEEQQIVKDRALHQKILLFVFIVIAL